MSEEIIVFKELLQFAFECKACGKKFIAVHIDRKGLKPLHRLVPADWLSSSNLPTEFGHPLATIGVMQVKRKQKNSLTKFFTEKP